MSSRSALVAVALLLVLTILGSAYLSASDYGRVTGLIDKAGKVERLSTATRVVTVRQRCELTSLMLSEARNPLTASRLSASYAACERQLVGVERIAALAHR